MVEGIKKYRFICDDKTMETDNHPSTKLIPKDLNRREKNLKSAFLGLKHHSR